MRPQLLGALAFSLVVLAVSKCNADTVGVHLVSAHQGGGYNNVNPGVFYRTDSGWTAGAYHNSVSKLSVYAGRTWGYGRLGLTLGLATGYPLAPVVPVIAPSVYIGAGFRVVGLPPVKGVASGVLHLTWEKQL